MTKYLSMLILPELCTSETNIFQNNVEMTLQYVVEHCRMSC